MLAWYLCDSKTDCVPSSFPLPVQTLNTAMKNVCEILTSDPEGGPARIPFETFAYVYQYLSGLDPELPAVETENYLTSLRLMS